MSVASEVKRVVSSQVKRAVASDERSGAAGACRCRDALMMNAG